ncbi:hypothetical protein SUGI_0807760 [Cryptomeria japonica]|uniref:uncharacterized protein LOC131041615 n=1 Tax=Cryptomeria japonica TaxID=3369 RepID=UPI0024148ABE|nr:uncharacterized protein LOC131041615 [Cryptomeria japonica]XP_057830731.2 uncharacterized protein LOC131041615 [Cryptomeria japonica]GLJ39526.1 hypothetical protein SUGI_0807760 [Cryptomeria japonica]
MHEGFKQVNENIEEMIEHVANEPSVGLYYVQHHIHTAVPLLHRIKVQVIDATREVFICTEDMEDAISSLKSMQECGPPIVEKMIRKLNSSISLMSLTHQPRGQHRPVNVQSRSMFMSKDNAVLSTLGSAFQTASRAAWRSNAPDVQYSAVHIGEIDPFNNENNNEGKELPLSTDAGTSSLVQSVFKSALQRAGTLGWSGSSVTEKAIQNNDGMLARSHDAEPLQAGVTHAPTAFNTCTEPESALSTAETVQILHTDVMNASMQNDKAEDDLPPASSPSLLRSDHTLERSENFEQFQAVCAAKLEAWLSESDEVGITSVQEYDLKPIV